MKRKLRFKKIVLRNYFKKPNVVFLFLMLSICTLMLVFFHDFKECVNKGQIYWQYKYKAPTFMPEIDFDTTGKEDNILDYEEGYYPGHHTFIKTVWYFTHQSNLFVLIVYALFFTKVRQKNWYHYVVFACLVSILMTALIFHTLIDKGRHFYEPEFSLSFFLSHLHHTLVPLCYLYFYFKVNSYAIPYKKMWIAFIHPLLYMTFFSLFGFLSMQDYFQDLQKDKPIITSEKQAAKRDPFKMFPYVFFSPFKQKLNNPANAQKLGDKENRHHKRYRFVYSCYDFVCLVFSCLFVFTVSMTYTLLWIKKRLLNKKTTPHYKKTKK
ncbi:hypothetical protein KEC49_01340 ['Elaeagnus angustifolia' witches'-broom phytoplasma]|uniref:Uncharacterized protein n=1 Tax='Elaeagnus angustifolia' witches'-broom phytoplasma TaxID=1538355 RepID=A0ABS5VAY3_9MOLU|nr:hypothetical protein ['Elaeagnus angustifolia' witches'-broom phytoplasma]MCX2955672.1 hypothetical protein [Candidatus Phytoplasma australiense]